MKRQILFVDDEANVLSGLRRMLRGQRKVWDMHFACGSDKALELLQEQRVDVIVSDMRMPIMDGAELLTRVSKEHPHTVRLVLSGQSEQEKIFRVIGPAHQFLSKPCDPDRLMQTIEQALNLQDHLPNEELLQLSSQITSLPSLPDVFNELVKELQSEDACIEKVGSIIENDLAMSAKVLQLVNSSFFGLPSHVTSPKHAVSLLGLNVIRPLALDSKGFRKFDGDDQQASQMDREIQHGLSVANAARRIAQTESDQAELHDEAFIAGLLHDIGKLIFSIQQSSDSPSTPPNYKEWLKQLGDATRNPSDTTFDSVGAHLLGLWGLSQSIVEAVALHHRPSDAHDTQFTPLTAVHVANAWCNDTTAARGAETISSGQLDHAYLQRLGVTDRLDIWKGAVGLENVS
ncbi:HDOD domain-containing protein [Rhodopirellula sp. JC740]|uniref:HDOD domain-containing protein n=1 Tax=Rhodopirellula halodulae TaxID=2894198 RepID=A0ABS8NEK9_9BACT|nr:HDOD domain-containing protein [Rhodopirellula sp. JC740]MCC9641980.1 HDOD domain-containing protein [Rhodopirellula sp. JC740]